MIPLAKPLLGKKEKKIVMDVLDSGYLTQGKYVKKFEDEFAAYIGTKFGVATSNGTTALHLMLLALGIGPGDEVITTPFTFIASANAILYTGARPVFVDIDKRSFNIDPAKIEANITRKTKAIMPVHLFGLPANMPEILHIAKKHTLAVLEDAAQAHGATIVNKKAGSFGLMAAFSFYATKNITTGEGGMITTDDKVLAERLRLLRSHGMAKRYYHDFLGYNFRMTDIAGAIGLVQLKRIDLFNRKRQENAHFLTEFLKNIEHITTPFVPKGYTHVFHQYTIRVKNNRDDLIKRLKKESIDSGIFYPLPIHKQQSFNRYKIHYSLPVAEQASKEVLSLPIHPGILKKDLLRIAKIVSE